MPAGVMRRRPSVDAHSACGFVCGACDLSPLRPYCFTPVYSMTFISGAPPGGCMYIVMMNFVSPS